MSKNLCEIPNKQNLVPGKWVDTRAFFHGDFLSTNIKNNKKNTSL